MSYCQGCATRDKHVDALRARLAAAEAERDHAVARAAALESALRSVCDEHGIEVEVRDLRSRALLAARTTEGV